MKEQLPSRNSAEEILAQRDEAYEILLALDNEYNRDQFCDYKKGDYAGLDRCGQRPLPCRRQAGFVMWAALAVVLALALVSQSIIYGVRVSGGIQMIFERAVVLVLKNVCVSDATKKHLAYMVRSFEPQRAIGQPASCRWGNDKARIFNFLDHPIRKHLVVEHCANCSIPGERGTVTESVFNAKDVTWRPAVVLNRQSFFVFEVGRVIKSQYEVNGLPVFPIPIGTASIDVGAFMPLGSYFGSFHHGLRSEPEHRRVDHQTGSEHRKRDSDIDEPPFTRSALMLALAGCLWLFFGHLLSRGRFLLGGMFCLLGFGVLATFFLGLFGQ